MIATTKAVATLINRAAWQRMHVEGIKGVVASVWGTPEVHTKDEGGEHVVIRDESGTVCAFFHVDVVEWE